MPLTATVDPKQVVVNFGEIFITGTADGDFFESDNSEDTWKKVVGADGEVVRIRNNDESVEVKVTVLQTSQANSLLQAAFAADKLSGAGRRAFFMKDPLTNTSVQGAGAYIKRQPKVMRGKDVKEVEWTFVLPVGLTVINGATLA